MTVSINPCTDSLNQVSLQPFFSTKVFITFESVTKELLYEFSLKDIATMVFFRPVAGLSIKKVTIWLILEKMPKLAEVWITNCKRPKDPKTLRTKFFL